MELRSPICLQRSTWMLTVLVVDDGKVDQRLAGRLLEKQLGASVRYADNGLQAIESIRQRLPDIVITDMRMPNMTGLELIKNSILTG